MLSLFSATCGNDDGDVPADVLRDYQRIFAACKQAIDSAQPVKEEIKQLTEEYFSAISDSVFQNPPAAQTTLFEFDDEREIFLTGDAESYFVSVTLAENAFTQQSRPSDEFEYGRFMRRTLTGALSGTYLTEFGTYFGGSDPMQMPPPDPEAPSSSPVGERYSCQVDKGRLIYRNIGASNFHDSERRLNATLEGRSLPTIDLRRRQICEGHCSHVSGSRVNAIDELAGEFGNLFDQKSFLLPNKLARLASSIDD